MKIIFMDNASTTKVDKEVIDTMIPFFSKTFGNPSSLHLFGREALEGLNQSREKVANLLNAKENEIIFTAGGTESDNIAIKGVAYQYKDKRKLKGPHIITSTIEHPAVLETCKHLETQGFQVQYLPVDKYGLININDLKESISENTVLITIMFANNEIGTIEPVEEIGKIAKANNIPFHTDAVQAIGKVPINVDKLNIDLLSISSHKIYGPKGVGALYIRKDVKLQPIVHGGGHEAGLRSSTHNMPGIVGLGKACELAKKRMRKDIEYLRNLRDNLIKNVLQIEESYLNGHPEKRLVNNAHFRFIGIEGESLLMKLDDKGIATSTGSACSSRKLKTSHVLTAIGLGPVESQGSLRVTIGRENTEDEVTYVNEVLHKVVNQLRSMSPLWNR
jgi:cysteine desulfurase